MSYLSKRKIEIHEERYRADMELHDRFQSFSAELLKLSLAGIGVTGFFIANISKEKSLFSNIINSARFRLSISLSVLMFALAVGFSLLHRFLASDGMYHHLRAIKHLIIKEELPDHKDLESDPLVPGKLDNEANKDEDVRNQKFKWSERFLYISAGSLLLAATLLGVSFIILMIN